MENYLLKSKRKEQYIHLKPSTNAAKLGIRPTLYQRPIKTGDTEKTQKIDIIKTVKQYAITNVFETQSKKSSREAEAFVFFLIDSSSSMLQYEQIASIKGIIGKTIEQHQYKKIRYATVALEQGYATLVTAPTMNIQQVLKHIETLTTGGKTNLKAGLKLIVQLLKNIHPHPCSLYIFTDGRINTGDTLTPFEETVTFYKTFLKHIRDTHVVDTESGFIKLKHSKTFAKAIGANYNILST